MLLLVLVITLILLCAKNKTKTNMDKRIYIKSSVDGKTYLVTHEKKANILAKLNQAKLVLHRHLINQNKYDDNVGVQRLLNKHPITLEEAANKQDVAYTVNKGDRIGICLHDSSHMINTYVFVMLHELAHVMTESQGHNDKFWEHFRLLLKEAEECGVYRYANYNDIPMPFCGIHVSYTPYEKKD